MLELLLAHRSGICLGLIMFLLFLSYQRQQVLLAPNKIVMTEALAVLGVTGLGKVVHVELANKG